VRSNLGLGSINKGFVRLTGLLLPLCFQLTCTHLLTSVSYPSENKPEREYQKLLEKLQRETSPVPKAKVWIKMSEIDLEEAAQLIKEGKLDEANEFLTRYIDVIRQANETLKNSRRNAQKNPAGFKEFEISLRKQLRKLADLKLSYPVDQRGKMEQAIACAESAQEDMLQAIFGPENTRRRKVENEREVEARDPQ
jgi:uncharacterized protein DUF5667